ncbi:DUF916 domain-containing protein [Candidatus Peregrinibacteria bacterium]|nr:DUF916 domain-containing protein [Candidatus Peregrinibacteria bacterium]
MKKNLLSLTTIFTLSIFLSTSVNAVFYANPTNPNRENSEYFYTELKPGETVTEKLTITNPDNVPEEYLIYPVHKFPPTQDGTVAYSLIDSDKQGFSEYTTIFPSEISLQAQETQEVDVIFKAPEDAEKKLYEGGVAVQSKSKTKQGAINLSVRKVIRGTFEITDNPEKPEKKLPKGIDPRQIYFWGSISLAVIFFGTLTAIKLKK